MAFLLQLALQQLILHDEALALLNSLGRGMSGAQGIREFVSLGKAEILLTKVVHTVGVPVAPGPVGEERLPPQLRSRRVPELPVCEAEDGARDPAAAGGLVLESAAGADEADLGDGGGGLPLAALAGGVVVEAHLLAAADLKIFVEVVF